MIKIFKGDSTIFAKNTKFITFNVNTDLDLSNWKAIFTLGSIKKVITDLTGKTFDIVLTNFETASLPLGDINGCLQLIDDNGNIKTINNTIPFNVTNEIVCTQHEKIDANIPECPTVNIEIKVGGKIVTSVNGMDGDVVLTFNDITGNISYNTLLDKPTVNNIELYGTMSLDDLGIQAKGDYAINQDIENKLDQKADANSISAVGKTGDYNDLINKPEIATKEYTDKQDIDTFNKSKKYIDTEIYRPQHNTMIVTAMQEGIGFKSDFTAREIKSHADSGGVVILRFNAPDGSGEQSYPYETFKDNYAIFRRALVDNKNNIVNRIIIKIDDRYNVIKEDNEIKVATLQNIQDLEDDKANYKIKVIGSDKVSQTDALEVLTYYDQYEGKLIEFLTNGEFPSKAVATGRIFTTKSGDSYLITYNLDGTTTVWNKDNYEKHNFECRNYINELVDLDNFTIDVRGDAPYIASVQNAINKPGGTSGLGVIQVIAYSITNQIQLYRDITTAKEYFRTITGEADRHSFSGWGEVLQNGIDKEMSDTSEHAVQNRIIKKYIDDKIAELKKEIGV